MRNVIEVYTQPSRSGASYTLFSDPCCQRQRGKSRTDGLAGSGARSAGALMVPNAHKSVTGRPHPAAGKVGLVFTIPDHPWVDSANGAAVRIAMTVGKGDGEVATNPVIASAARQSMPAALHGGSPRYARDDGVTGTLPVSTSLTSPADAPPAGEQSGPAGDGKPLTLTGLYNVLQALKEGRPLTAKEKAIHTQALVGVLRDLHDKLDAAVLAAYGWSDQPATDKLLSRLVALNAQRAAEEKTGHVRWLRPEFQHPAVSQTLSNQEQQDQYQQALQADLALDTPTDPAIGAPGPVAAAAALPWPATLPEQVRAVANVLASASAALSLPELAANFTGRGAWKKSLPRILDTLEALGRAQPVAIDGDVRWRA